MGLSNVGVLRGAIRLFYWQEYKILRQSGRAGEQTSSNGRKGITERVPKGFGGENGEPRNLGTEAQLRSEEEDMSRGADGGDMTDGKTSLMWGRCRCQDPLPPLPRPPCRLSIVVIVVVVVAT